MSEYEQVQFNGIGSISHLSDVRSRKRKRPLGFVPNQTKARPKKKATPRRKR